MNCSRLLLTAAAALALAGCAKEAEAPKEDVVAVIDGKPLSRNTFEQYVAGVTSKPVAEISVKERDELLDGLVRASVVAAEAERSGIATRPEVAATLDIQRLTILQRASAQELLKDRQPSEEELRAEYEIRIEQMDKTQFHLSHIQVDSAEAAQKLIAELDKGAKFDALARQHSMDANSKAQGGDLQWVPPSALPESFAVALREMKKGQHSKTPLKTDFGWHVLLLQDTREATPPPFESAREQLVQAVQQKQFEAWVDGLMQKAEVTKTP